MARNKQSKQYLPLVRAVAVVSAVGIVTAGVTFAALQSTGNALTGNTIETATASLQLSKNGSAFSDSLTGFDFNSIIPGGAAQPAAGYPVWVKNTGTTNLSLSVSVPTQPTVSGIADLSKVHVVITPLAQGAGNGSYPPLSFTLAELVAAPQPLSWGTSHGLLGTGSGATFNLQVSMDSDAVSGGYANISGLDIAFSGSPQ